MLFSLVRFYLLKRHITVETEAAQANCIYRPWGLPDSAVTPEPYYLRRREFLRVFGLGLAASALLPPMIRAESAALNDSLNPSYKLDGVKLTPEDLITSYNNFYEWGLAKDQPKELASRGWKTRRWSIETSAARWVDDHGECLYRYALVRVHKPGVAEDLVQETFLAAVRGYEKFGGLWRCGSVLR